MNAQMVRQNVLRFFDAFRKVNARRLSADQHSSVLERRWERKAGAQGIVLPANGLAPRCRQPVTA